MRRSQSSILADVYMFGTVGDARDVASNVDTAVACYATTSAGSPSSLSGSASASGASVCVFATSI